MRPVAILGASALAILLHEAGHVAVAAACGVRVKGVGIWWFSPYIRRERGAPWQEVLITLAGPGANLLTACVTLRIGRDPELCTLSLAIAFVSLLPLPCSDGLRAYKLLSSIFRTIA